MSVLRMLGVEMKMLRMLCWNIFYELYHILYIAWHMYFLLNYYACL